MVHVLQTCLQAVIAEMFWGCSMVEHLDRVGFLKAVEAGHEAAAHGRRWLPHSLYRNRETERAHILRNQAAIEAATGVLPVGIMCRGGQSP